MQSNTTQLDSTTAHDNSSSHSIIIIIIIVVHFYPLEQCGSLIVDFTVRSSSFHFLLAFCLPVFCCWLQSVTFFFFFFLFVVVARFFENGIFEGNRTRFQKRWKASSKGLKFFWLPLDGFRQRWWKDSAVKWCVKSRRDHARPSEFENHNDDDEVLSGSPPMRWSSPCQCLACSN